MSAAANEQAPALSGIRKTAILLVVLGEKASAEILREFDEEEVHQIGREVARIGSIAPEQRDQILEEFYQMSVAHEFVIKGGVEYAKKMLINAFGQDSARSLLDRLMKTIGNDMANFDALQKADPQQLAKFIHNEHPQTIALILSHLNPSQAAALLSSLPAEMRGDVALRMASLDQISPDIIARIATIIGQKLKALGELSRESYGGIRAVAEMFNRLDSVTSKEILENIENANPALVETVRHLMFVFEDLLTMDASAIVEILSRVDREHVPARRGHAARGDGHHGPREDQGRRGGAAADHRRGAADGGRRSHQHEGRRRRRPVRDVGRKRCHRRFSEDGTPDSRWR
jgi:flagellar motor switch protein FliG